MPVVLWWALGGASIGFFGGFAASEGAGKIADAAKWGAGAAVAYYAFQAAKGAGAFK